MPVKIAFLLINLYIEVAALNIDSELIRRRDV